MAKYSKPLSPRDKAIRLIEGGIVEIANDTFKVEVIPGEEQGVPCDSCSIDSICRFDHIDVCSELDYIAYHKYRLKLAHD